MTALSKRVARLESNRRGVDLAACIRAGRERGANGEAPRVPTAQLEVQLREHFDPLLAAIIAGRKRCGIA